VVSDNLFDFGYRVAENAIEMDAFVKAKSPTIRDKVDVCWAFADVVKDHTDEDRWITDELAGTIDGQTDPPSDFAAGVFKFLWECGRD
jgi:hypothetical protein